MHPLPVTDVVAAAYRFTYRHLATIFAICAVPFIALEVFKYFTTRAIFAAQIEALETTGTLYLASAEAQLAVVGNAAGQSVIIAIAAILLHRMILFGERAPRFRFSAAEGWFVLISLAAGAAVGVILLAQNNLQGGLSGVFGFVALAVAIALGFAAIRGSQIFPVIVAENRVDFVRAWSLTRGNFWMMVAAYIIATLPIGIFYAIPIMVGMLANIEFGRRAPLPSEMLASLIAFQQANAIAFGVLYFVLDVLMTAICVGLLSFSYKVFNGQTLDATLTGPDAPSG